MKESLLEQLMGAGLVDTKKAKSVQKEQRKNKKKKPKGHLQVDGTKLAAQEALKQKSAKDREQNKKLNIESEKKAIRAQIRQLILSNTIERGNGDIAYQFNDGGRIKKVSVTSPLKEQLARGLIAIAKTEGSYYLVPKLVADKILLRDENSIVLLNEKTVEDLGEDPYADFEIPDDLMW